MGMPAVVQHLDRCLAAVAQDAEVARRLEYATDTHSAENWLRTELAYRLSGPRYPHVKGYWAHPERHGLVDLPIMCRQTGPRALVELKMLHNGRERVGSMKARFARWSE